jgi:putative endopeptidase
MRRVLFAAAAVAALSAAAPALANDCLNAPCTMVSLIEAEPAGGSAAATPLVEAGAIGPWGFDLAGRNTSVKPGEDFFAYANGGWFDRTEIPADRSSYSMFTRLTDQSELQARAILEEAAAGRVRTRTPPSSARSTPASSTRRA